VHWDREVPNPFVINQSINRRDLLTITEYYNDDVNSIQ